MKLEKLISNFLIGLEGEVAVQIVYRNKIEAVTHRQTVPISYWRHAENTKENKFMICIEASDIKNAIVEEA